MTAKGKSIWDDDPAAVPVGELRRFARERAKHVSIRAMADEIGVGRTTFHKFVLANTDPQPRTRHLLHRWYHAQVAGEVAEKKAALAALVDSLPDKLRGPATTRLLDHLECMHREAGQDVPRWVASARTDLTEEAGDGNST